MGKPQTIKIDDIEYVRVDSMQQEELNDDDYVIVRSKDSGVHAGYLESKDNATVVLKNARRIWYWKGAATLSELAVNGTKSPDDCKFPTPVKMITVMGVCEIIPTSIKAKKSIEGVPIWQA